MAITKKKYEYPGRGWVEGESEVTHEGRVYRVFREDFRAMSDIYTVATFAEVVNDDYSTHRVLVNANFECDVSGGHAEVDVTPEMVREVEARKERLHREAENARLKREEEIERDTPRVGKKMTVFKGRKVPKGTTGVVAFISFRTGGVLLKPEDRWQDRSADGVWVNPQNLCAV